MKGNRVNIAGSVTGATRWNTRHATVAAKVLAEMAMRWHFRRTSVWVRRKASYWTVVPPRTLPVSVKISTRTTSQSCGVGQCVYKKKDNDGWVYICLHVGDMIVAARSVSTICTVKEGVA